MKRLLLFYVWPVLLPTLCQAEAFNNQSKPSDNVTPRPMVSLGPDERILWSLFHAGKIVELKRQIADLQRRFPAWQVPPDLQQLLTQPAPQNTRSHPTQRKTPHTSPTTIDGCVRIDRQWQKAEALQKQGRFQAAVAVYARILQHCHRPDLIQATLAKSITLPQREDYFSLTTQAAGDLPENELQQLEYQWLKNAYLSRLASESTFAPVNESELQYGMERYQDADLAMILAWRAFERQAYRAAYDGFDQASRWQPTRSDARLGKMLSLEKLEDYDGALALYSADAGDANIHEVAARLYKLKAWQDLQAARLPQAEQNLAKARAIVTSPDPEIQQIEAWIADGRQHHAEAAGLFADLYRQTPDNAEYARAYVRNQSQTNRDELARKAATSGGLLQDEYEQLQGRELYQRKQFLAAYDKTPGQFSGLANIDAPSADLGVYARHKSGEPGLSRLDILKLPNANGTFTVDGIHHFNVSLSRVELDSGRPGACAALGSLSPEAANTCRPSALTEFEPITQLNDGYETDVSYRMDGRFSPYLRLGHTPTGGVIDPAITFDVGFVRQTATGNWAMNVYSQPVRQSILSYTGIRDPYLFPIRDDLNPVLKNLGLNKLPDDLEWGRVLRSVVRASGYHGFDEHWGLAAAAEVAMLNGENVADNTAVALSVNPGFNIALDDFDYFSIGPALAYEHYEKNLSHFTLGHGGYFSPEHYINLGPSLQFLSKEGRPLVFKGHVSAGIQMIEEADSPWFPLLAPGLGKYEAKNGFSVSDALDIELKGVWLATPNLQLGAGAAVRHTANYEDFSGGLFVRFLFQDRKASYSSDIPNAMFNGIQAY